MRYESVLLQLKKKSIIEFLVPNVRNDLSVYNCLPVISLHVTFNLSCSCFYFLGSDIHPNCFGFNSYNMFLNWLYAHIMTFSSYIQSSFLHLSLVNRGWNFVHLVNIRGSKGQGTWHPSFSRKKNSLLYRKSLSRDRAGPLSWESLDPYPVSNRNKTK